VSCVLCLCSYGQRARAVACVFCVCVVLAVHRASVFYLEHAELVAVNIVYGAACLHIAAA